MMSSNKLRYTDLFITVNTLQAVHSPSDKSYLESELRAAIQAFRTSEGLREGLPLQDPSKLVSAKLTALGIEVGPKKH